MSGLTALVTGGSSGIGREFVEQYVRRGAVVHAVGRDATALRQLEEWSRNFPGSVTTSVVDLSDPHGVEALFARCPSPDVVVVNAGVTMAGRVGTNQWDDLSNMTHLIGTGVAQLLESVAPAMAARGRGDIIIVSSIASLIDMPGSAVYAASKAFATSYGRSLHREMRAVGVRVCVVCPGYVRTNLHGRSGLGHLTRQVPRWLWVDTETVVECTERGLRRGTAVVVPGLLYRLSLPLLNFSAAQNLWSRLTRRSRASAGDQRSLS